MKNLLAILAVAILGSAFAFAAYTAPTFTETTTNNFSATIWCTPTFTNDGGADDIFLGNFFNGVHTYSSFVGVSAINYTLTAQPEELFDIVSTVTPTGSDVVWVWRFDNAALNNKELNINDGQTKGTDCAATLGFKFTVVSLATTAATTSGDKTLEVEVVVTMTNSL